MRYFGGKQRVAKHIANYLNTFPKDLNFYEPFVGGMNIVQHTHFKNIICSDICEDLILLYKGIQDKSFEIPSYVSREQYYFYKNADPSALRGFIGFGCSFAGKWFGGYAHSKDGRNYANNARNYLIKKFKDLENHNISFLVKNFFDLEVFDSVIYLDPPYKNTTKYDYNKAFNHEDFWDKCRLLAKNNILVISEYQAPEDFGCVKMIHTKTDIKVGDGSKAQRVEKLFMHTDFKWLKV